MAYQVSEFPSAKVTKRFQTALIISKNCSAVALIAWLSASSAKKGRACARTYPTEAYRADIVLKPANSSYLNASVVERIDVDHALRKSRVGKLHGSAVSGPVPQRGAFDIQQQLDDKRPSTHYSLEAETRTQVDPRMQAISISANLKYELQKGAISEATPAPGVGCDV